MKDADIFMQNAQQQEKKNINKNKNKQTQWFSPVKYKWLEIYTNKWKWNAKMQKDKMTKCKGITVFGNLQF